MKARDIIALSMIKGVGNSFIKKNLESIVSSPSAQAFIKNNNINVENDVDIDLFYKKADFIIEECQQNGYDIVDITDARYPSCLKEISDPPAVLHMIGNEDLLNNAIAIIGSRHSSDLGNRIAARLGKYFSKDYSICNGLVEGIDEHSIYVEGRIISNVIGVISGGLNYHETCSKRHAKVIDDVISAGGLIISEFEPRMKEDQFSGSKVSRIQAGLSKGLILVQSAKDGGSKYTVKAFSKLNRTIGVIHFPSNTEYQTDLFSANRLVAEKGIDGLAEFIGMKTTKGISVNAIVRIEGQNDYITFKNKISECKTSLW